MGLAAFTEFALALLVTGGGSRFGGGGGLAAGVHGGVARAVGVAAGAEAFLFTAFDLHLRVAFGFLLLGFAIDRRDRRDRDDDDENERGESAGHG